MKATLSLAMTLLAAWASAGQGEPILGLHSYWRSFYVLRPARTSPRLWKSAELPTEGRSGKKWADWAAAGRDWSKLRDEHRLLWFQFCGHMDTSPLVTMLDSPPPPAGWTDPGFDDSAWPRSRYPLLMNSVDRDQMDNWSAYKHGIATACFRARVVVPDPGRVGRLRLRVVYRGGLCAWVNGREISRGHLPPGPIAPDTAAEEYPEDAYTLPPGAGYTKGNRCVPDIGIDYRGSTAGGHDGYWKVPLTREEWDTVLRRRDRVLGPIDIPAGLLRKGVNVVALQVVRADLNPIIFLGTERLGANTHYGWSALGGGASWSHGCVLDVELRAEPAGAVQAEERPVGVQVWAEDPNRRVFSAEFGEAGRPPRALRLVGARQGTHSAQLVVGTDRELRGLAATAGDLAGPSGAKIPASALTVRYAVPRSVKDLALLGVERNPKWAREDPLFCDDTWMALWRFDRRGPDGELPYRRHIPYNTPDGKVNPDELRKANVAALEAAMARIRFFDELSPRPPASVPANSCQPVWLTVKVPERTPPGLYVGTLAVAAEGMAPERLPVRLQVVDWGLPDPTRGQDFSTLIGMEQSPWGVARAHRVTPWSDEHFRHIEGSLQRMGELGNDWLMIPILLHSEFGNLDDSFVPWVKGKDGRLGCDFSRFDRYMGLALKRAPKPRVVCFVVAHPPENNLWVIPKVLMRDEAAGKAEPFTVPMGEASPFRGKDAAFSPAERAEATEFWRPFVEGVMHRMKARGLEGSVFWGFVWDAPYSVDRYKDIFAELAPGVKWARGSHGHGGVMGKQGLSGSFGCVGTIVTLPQPVREVREADGRRRYFLQSHKGWQTDVLSFSLPRVQNAVLGLEGRSVPFLWRLYPELALVGGARGICRIGVDAWEGACMDGWAGGCQVGIGIVACLWPGEGEAHSSARFEMLREGMQEAEARVFLEKALEGPLAGTPQGQRIQKLLDDRIMATLHVPRSFYILRMAEQYAGWQERSWGLYAAAAEAAGGTPPAEADKARFFGPGQ